MATDHLLRKGNSELAQIGVYTWSIPALSTRSEVAGFVKTCPNAGVCAALCYARNGRYKFSNVAAAHRRNLDSYLINRGAWLERLTTELQAKRFRPTGKAHQFTWPVRSDYQWWVDSGGRAVRIHDAGDFFDDDYLADWLRAAAATPDVLFYAYTKQVSSYKAAEAAGLVPSNFVIIFSMGGRQDHLVDVNSDRHDDIFPTLEALEEAGYTNQEESDLMAALLPTNRIGIVANNIPAFKKRQGSATFAELQRKA